MFWCTEAVFKMLRGCRKCYPGYSGGDDKPTYEQVSSGNSGHAEVIEITFDPNSISFEDLLTVFLHHTIQQLSTGKEMTSELSIDL